MPSKRDQRQRRKARAALRALEREFAALRPVALAAVRYVGLVDAPNPAEPSALAQARDELKHVVHVHQGRSERWLGSVRPAAPPAPVIAIRFPTLPPAPKKETSMPTPSELLVHRETCRRLVEAKRHDLHHAAQRFGAVANSARRRADLAPLADAVDVAARAFANAERQLAAADAELESARRAA